METVLELADQLEAQLLAAERVASTRAEHLRLSQMRATLTELRATVHLASATAA